jgi:hypothetical protein
MLKLVNNYQKELKLFKRVTTIFKMIKTVQMGQSCSGRDIYIAKNARG